MCAVTTKKIIRGKLNDKGTVGLFIGYQQNHTEDDNQAGHPESRITLAGFIMCLLGVSICWRSKAQKGVR